MTGWTTARAPGWWDALITTTHTCGWTSRVIHMGVEPTALARVQREHACSQKGRAA